MKELTKNPREAITLEVLKSDEAYWLYVQQETEPQGLALTWRRATYATVRVPLNQRFDRKAIEELAALKRAVVKPIRVTAGPYG